MATRPLHIANVIRNAVVFDLKNWQAGLVDADSLLQSVPRLFALLGERHIDYVLVGGVAMLQYVEGRNTEDIDLIMAVAALERLPEVSILSQEPYFARGKFEELQIDISLTRNRLFDKVRQHYSAIQSIAEQDIQCATVEGLLLLKLYALPSLYRQGDFVRVGLYENDIPTLMYTYRPALEPLMQELAKHLSETDLSALRDILAEIQERIDRFGKGLN
jgi:hypothetical protein